MTDEEKKAKQKARKSAATAHRQATVKHRKVGNKYRVIYPDNTQEVLEDKFVVDETSKTGLRWSYSKHNLSNFRGKEAGCLHNVGSGNYKAPKYVTTVYINGTFYRMATAHIVWMLVFKDKPIGDYLVDHEDRNPLNNKASNLRLSTEQQNSSNRGCRSKSGYKNVVAHHGTNFIWKMMVNNKSIWSSPQKSKHAALLMGWVILTSGRIPLDCVRFQPKEYMDGTYLQRALAECEKQGIAVTPPKYKTLYEYIASVEGSC